MKIFVVAVPQADPQPQTDTGEDSQGLTNSVRHKHSSPSAGTILPPNMNTSHLRPSNNPPVPWAPHVNEPNHANILPIHPDDLREPANLGKGFYVVTKGLKVGIWADWGTVGKFVTGVPYASHIKFDTWTAAQEYYTSNYNANNVEILPSPPPRTPKKKKYIGTGTPGHPIVISPAGTRHDPIDIPSTPPTRVRRSDQPSASELSPSIRRFHHVDRQRLRETIDQVWNLVNVPTAPSTPYSSPRHTNNTDLPPPPYTEYADNNSEGNNGSSDVRQSDQSIGRQTSSLVVEVDDAASVGFDFNEFDEIIAGLDLTSRRGRNALTQGHVESL